MSLITRLFRLFSDDGHEALHHHGSFAKDRPVRSLDHMWRALHPTFQNHIEALHFLHAASRLGGWGDLNDSDVVYEVLLHTLIQAYSYCCTFSLAFS